VLSDVREARTFRPRLPIRSDRDNLPSPAWNQGVWRCIQRAPQHPCEWPLCVRSRLYHLNEIAHCPQAVCELGAGCQPRRTRHPQSQNRCKNFLNATPYRLSADSCAHRGQNRAMRLLNAAIAVAAMTAPQTAKETPLKSAQPTQLLRTISETALYLAQHGIVNGRVAFFRRRRAAAINRSPESSATMMPGTEQSAHLSHPY